MPLEASGAFQDRFLCDLWLKNWRRTSNSIKKTNVFQLSRLSKKKQRYGCPFWHDNPKTIALTGIKALKNASTPSRRAHGGLLPSNLTRTFRPRASQKASIKPLEAFGRSLGTKKRPRAAQNPSRPPIWTSRHQFGTPFRCNVQSMFNSF